MSFTPSFFVKKHCIWNSSPKNGYYEDMPLVQENLFYMNTKGVECMGFLINGGDWILEVEIQIINSELSLTLRC